MRKPPPQTASTNAPGRRSGLPELLAILSPARRRQLHVVLALTLLGAVSELMTIGAVVPLLVIASDPSRAMAIPGMSRLFLPVMALFGIGPMVTAALFLSLAAAFATLLRIWLNWRTQRFIFAFHQDLVLRIFDRSMRQPYEWYATQNSSVLLAAFEKAYLITSGLVAPLVLAASSAVMALVIGVFLLAINPTAALIAILVVGSVYIIMTLTTRRISHSISATLSRVRAARVKVLQESLGGIRDIILDETYPVFEENMASLEIQHTDVLAKSGTISLSPRLVVEGAVIVLVAGLALWFNSRPGGMMHALPVLGALALGTQRLLPMVQVVYFGYVSATFYRDSVGDVLEVLNLPVAHRAQDGSPPPPVDFRDRIELRDVSFEYVGGQRAISDISLTIAKGERIGFIGKTGSGKSTLIDIVMGLLSPSEGWLLVDGEVVSPEDDRSWKAQVAHVPQSIFLSDDSIAANIAFGQHARDIDMARVDEAARQAGLSTFIAQLPSGFDTSVGERGVRLSGGQRQRIGIARALYKRAQVLVLDEATSALDDQTEREVMEAVASLRPDITIILIAHRLSTLKICDKIYRLSGGSIAGVGSYDQMVGVTAEHSQSG